MTQLGATFVIGPGEQVRYEHVDDHSADHAPLDAGAGRPPDRRHSLFGRSPSQARASAATVGKAAAAALPTTATS